MTGKRTYDSIHINFHPHNGNDGNKIQFALYMTVITAPKINEKLQIAREKFYSAILDASLNPLITILDVVESVVREAEVTGIAPGTLSNTNSLALYIGSLHGKGNDGAKLLFVINAAKDLGGTANGRKIAKQIEEKFVPDDYKKLFRICFID